MTQFLNDFWHIARGMWKVPQMYLAISFFCFPMFQALSDDKWHWWVYPLYLTGAWLVLTLMLTCQLTANRHEKKGNQ